MILVKDDWTTTDTKSFRNTSKGVQSRIAKLTRKMREAERREQNYGKTSF